MGHIGNINNRVLSGCDQHLDNGGGFKNKIDCTWKASGFDGKGCPVFTYNGTEYESYSWWYAVRTNAQRVIWMCARSAVNTKTLTETAKDVTLSNVYREVFEGVVGEDIEIEVVAPSELSSATISIDPFTPLPEGLEFNGNKITGSSDVPVNKFIHVLFTEGNTVKGVTFELRIYAAKVNVLEMADVVEEVEPDIKPDDKEPEKKKGCFGGIEASLLSIATLSIMAAGALFIDRKRKIAK